MKKILIMMIVTLGLQASSAKYDVNFRGMTLGEIDDLSTVKSLYLKAKVTSRIARFMLGKDNLVYYGGEKPDIKNSKYKRDKKMMLFAFAQSLEERPKYKRYDINQNKYITLECQGSVCRFNYYKNENIDGKGKISFDEKNDFVSLTEELTHFEIVRQ